MDDGLKKKLMGAAAAAVAAFAFGESQIMDMDARLAALEELHPELAQEEATAILPSSKKLNANEAAEGLKEETPSASAPPADADHLELNEDDEWVPVEESSEEPVEEVIEEIEEN